MARSAAAATRTRPARSGGRRAAHAKRKPAARRVSGHAGSGRAERNAAAIGRAKKASSAKKAATAGRPTPRKPAARQSAARKRGGARLATAGAPLAIRVAEAPFARAARARVNGILDALLHGQGWIVLIGLLLAGIVFFNVDLLQMNRDIAGTAKKAAAVKRDNSRLRTELARLGSSERIQRVAAERGLLLPAPGDVRYLRVDPSSDGQRAARLLGKPGYADAPGTEPAPLAAAPPATPAPPAATPQPATPPAATTTPPAGSAPPATASPTPGTAPTAAVPPAGAGAGTTASPTG